MAMADQQKVFAQRLKRIDSGQGNTMGRIHCGIEEIPVKNQSAVAATSRFGASLLIKLIWIPISLAIALTIGIIATVLARVGLFQAVNATGLELSLKTGLIADAAAALMLAIVLCFLFRVRKNYHMVASVVGACLMIGGMHQLVHDAPDLWSKAFSPEWVQQVVSSTKPDSFEFKGLTVVGAI